MKRANRRLLAGVLRATVVIGAAFGVASTTCAPRAAWADDQRLAAALKKFEDGRADYEAGKFEEALVAFRASYELSASPNSRLYAARCLRALGKVASAYTAFRLAAREAQDRLSATGEKRYGATRDAAASEGAELEPRVPRLTVAVPAGTPAGFAVRVNGAELPAAAWGVAVETDPGEALVEASGPRTVPFQARVTLAEGEQRRVDVTAARVPTGTLVLRFVSRPAGMAVEIDHTPVDASGAAGAREVDAGAHEIVVSAPGYARFTWRGTLADQQTVEATVDLRPMAVRAGEGSGGTPKWAFFAVGGAAVAALGAGTVVALHAKSAEDAELAKDPYQRDAATRDSIRSQSTTANILFAAGGVLAVGCAVLGLTTRWRSEEARGVAVEPWLGAGGAGVGAHGRF